MHRFLFILFLLPYYLFSQINEDQPLDAPSDAAEKIEIKPLAKDIEIKDRLEAIYQATGWFIDIQVEVREGIVFLEGWAKTEEHKKWAGNLARNTQNVVAVVNKMQLMQPPLLDFSILKQRFQNQWRHIARSVPTILIGLIILIVSWILAKLGSFIVGKALSKKFQNSLLRTVIAKVIGILIFLFGIYLIFELADLTGAALTIISGTGLLGIILGIAFRDITENFLASILLSIHNPFKNSDLVEIAGVVGFVQRLTMRMTLLMSLDGNHIQIPNATVYKSIIRNFSSNRNRREQFFVGIGYENAITKAQEVASAVLEKHVAVLKDPEPMVLVDRLGSSTIQLCIYFWIDGQKHSWLKVRSSVIRLVKKAFQEAGISMPDEARERIFLNDLSVEMHELQKPKKPDQPIIEQEPASASSDSHASLESEAKDIKEQAKQARKPEKGKNLLEDEHPI